MLIDTSNNTHVMGIFSIWLVQPLPYHSNAFHHSASKVVLLKCLGCYNNILVMWVFMAQYLVTAKRKITLAKLPRFHYNQMICEIVTYTIVYKFIVSTLAIWIQHLVYFTYSFKRLRSVKCFYYGIICFLPLMVLFLMSKFIA